MPKMLDPMSPERGAQSKTAPEPKVRQESTTIQVGSPHLDAGRLLDRGRKALRGTPTERALRACQRAAKKVVSITGPDGAKRINPFLLATSLGTASRMDGLLSQGLAFVKQSEDKAASGGLDRAQRALKPYEKTLADISEGLKGCVADVKQAPLKLIECGVALPPVAAFNVEVVKTLQRESSAMSRLVNIGDCRTEEELRLAFETLARQKDVLKVIPKTDAQGTPLGPQRLLNGFVAGVLVKKGEREEAIPTFFGIQKGKGDAEPSIVVSAHIHRVPNPKRGGAMEEKSVIDEGSALPFSVWAASRGVPGAPKIAGQGVPEQVLDLLQTYKITPVFGQTTQHDLLPSAFPGSELAMGCKLAETAAIEAASGFVEDYIEALEAYAGAEPVLDNALTTRCSPLIEEIKRMEGPSSRGFETSEFMKLGKSIDQAKSLFVGYLGTERERWLQSRGYGAAKLIQAFRDYQTQYSLAGRMKGSPFLVEVEPALAETLEMAGFKDLFSALASSKPEETHTIGKYVDSLFVRADTNFKDDPIPEGLFGGAKSRASRINELDGVQRHMACGMRAMQEAKVTLGNAYAASIVGVGLTSTEQKARLQSFQEIIEPILGEEAQGKAVASVNKALGKKLGEAHKALQVAMGNALGSAVAQVAMAKPSDFRLHPIQGNLVASRAAVIFGAASDTEAPSENVAGYDENIKALTMTDSFGELTHPILRVVQDPAGNLGALAAKAFPEDPEVAQKRDEFRSAKLAEREEAIQAGTDTEKVEDFHARVEALALEAVPMDPQILRKQQNYIAELTRARETFHLVGTLNQALDTPHKLYGDLARFLRNLGRLKDDHIFAKGRSHFSLDSIGIRPKLGQASLYAIIPVKGKEEGVTYKGFWFGKKHITGDLELIAQKFLTEGELAKVMLDNNSANVAGRVRRGKVARGESANGLDSLLNAAMETWGSLKITDKRYLAAVQVRGSGYMLGKLGLNLAMDSRPVIEDIGGNRVGGVRDPWVYREDATGKPLDGPHFKISEGGFSQSDSGRARYFPATAAGVATFEAYLNDKRDNARLEDWEKESFEKKVKPALVGSVTRLIQAVGEASTADKPYKLLTLAPNGADEARPSPWAVAVVAQEEVPDGTAGTAALARNESSMLRAACEIVGWYQSLGVHCEPIHIDLSGAEIEV